jgi:hypothetical protein
VEYTLKGDPTLFKEVSTRSLLKEIQEKDEKLIIECSQHKKEAQEINRISVIVKTILEEFQLYHPYEKAQSCNTF